MHQDCIGCSFLSKLKVLRQKCSHWSLFHHNERDRKQSAFLLYKDSYLSPQICCVCTHHKISRNDGCNGLSQCCCSVGCMTQKFSTLCITQGVHTYSSTCTSSKLLQQILFWCGSSFLHTVEKAWIKWRTLLLQVQLLLSTWHAINSWIIFSIFDVCIFWN